MSKITTFIAALEKELVARQLVPDEQTFVLKTLLNELHEDYFGSSSDQTPTLTPDVQPLPSPTPTPTLLSVPIPTITTTTPLPKPPRTIKKISMQDFVQWMKTPGQGGLGVAGLRAKAIELGFENAAVIKLKKDEISKILQPLIDDNAVTTTSSIIEDLVKTPADAPKTAPKKPNTRKLNFGVGPTVPVDYKTGCSRNDINKWFASEPKGGLPLIELKSKAKEYGIIPDKFGKQELLDAFLTLVEPIEKATVAKAAQAQTKIQSDEKQNDKIEIPEKQNDEIKIIEKQDTEIKIIEKQDNEIKIIEKQDNEIKIIENKETSPNENVEKKTIADEFQQQCKFIVTKGPRKGERCTIKPKYTDEFCGKHKTCKTAKSSKENESESESTSDVPAPKNYVAADKTKKVSNESVQCQFVLIRGDDKGTMCKTSPKTDEQFCTKHANTQQALDYRANACPEAKAAAKKMSNEILTPLIEFGRNRALNVWYILGTNLVVNSPKDRLVTGCIINDTIASLTEKEYAKITELGLPDKFYAQVATK